MKLYTKEMFLKAAEKCEVSMIDAKHIMKYIDEYVTAIELPSDEEIEIASPYVPRDAHDYYHGDKDGFIDGAKWMRDKIINQNK
jgi:hypothetical protein